MVFAVIVQRVFKPHFCFFVSFFCMCVFLCSFFGPNVFFSETQFIKYFSNIFCYFTPKF